jgi:hypothetical protein
MLQATSGNEWKQCRESNLLVVGCMVPVLTKSCLRDRNQLLHFVTKPPEGMIDLLLECGKLRLPAEQLPRLG